MFLCKIIFEISTKSGHDSRKIHMLKLKMQQILEPQVGLRLMYLLTKPVLKNKFVKVLRIFYIEIDIL